MKIRKNISLLFSLFLASMIYHSAYAQQVGFVLWPNQFRTEIYFENLNNLIIVPVTLNNVLTTKFILDSGVNTTILTERSLCDLLGITCERTISLPVIGSKEKIDACIAVNSAINIPGIAGKNLNLLVLEEDLLNLKNYLGENVYGIIGYDLLRHFVVKINYTAKMVTFMDPAHFKPPRRYTAIPIEIVNGKPYLTAEIQLSGDSIYPCRLLFDLGASHSILFDLPENNGFRIPGKHINASVGRGLGGDIEGVFTRISAIRINNINIKNVVVSFSKDYKVADTIGSGVLQGTLGGEIISRFSVIMDYFGRKIYLKKNYTFNEPFDYNLSGIDLIATGIGLKRFEITSVLSDSPGSKADIKTEDVIIEVNGVSAENLTLNEINHTLRSVPGKIINLKIDRKGEIIKKKLRLERML